ncbi:4Fe-4S dicluster domain-containing protein [uncultured Desulfovibrio sp.]|uniref:4Fe-4S dicluster domain-containing protein n=1 Tax=uncultured Desulfovibrio sp. TaxID=167968 RepID=UPI002638B0ED|nr:4Fe-4S dicluster domain-containing protein [uncultured Desulfovibrio sp.]
MNRRKFLALLGSAGVTGALAGPVPTAAKGHVFPGYPDSYGVLHDVTRCIGCRQCEEACNAVNHLPQPEIPFSDRDILGVRRRTSAYQWTVINQYTIDDKPFFRKLQCFHCNEPACASACFAKCFSKNPDGSVSYNGDHCVGCRYCMIACPFYVPGFQYDEPFDPLVQKCTFCKSRLDEGLLPGCVEACPMDALTFGHRNDLIKLAHRRIEENPGRYSDYIYGENDAGGTAWMVLAPASRQTAGKAHLTPYEASGVMHDLGLDTHLGDQPMGELTYGALGTVPLIVAFWPILIGGIYGITKSREARNEMRNKIMRAAVRQDMAAAMDDAVRRIERDQGPEAAEAARKALEDAVEERRLAALDAAQLARKEDH